MSLHAESFITRLHNSLIHKRTQGLFSSLGMLSGKDWLVNENDDAIEINGNISKKRRIDEVLLIRTMHGP